MRTEPRPWEKLDRHWNGAAVRSYCIRRPAFSADGRFLLQPAVPVQIPDDDHAIRSGRCTLTTVVLSPCWRRADLLAP